MDSLQLAIRSISPIMYWLFGAPNAALGNPDPEKMLIVLSLVIIGVMMGVVFYCVPQCLRPKATNLPDDFTGNRGAHVV